jgi:hypothetical protein
MSIIVSLNADAVILLFTLGKRTTGKHRLPSESYISVLTNIVSKLDTLSSSAATGTVHDTALKLKLSRQIII